jgi:hypothetical protein
LETGSLGVRATFGWQSIQFCFARAHSARASAPFSTLKQAGGKGTEDEIGLSDSHKKRLFEHRSIFDQVPFQ